MQQMTPASIISLLSRFSPPTNCVLIDIVTRIATLSIMFGLSRGVKLLSELTLWLSFLILVFFLIFGPTHYLLDSLLQNIADYLLHVIYVGDELQFVQGIAGGCGSSAVTGSRRR